MSHVPMSLPELVISTQIHPFAATSSFVKLDDGRIFHASKGVCNYSEDGGLTWSEPQFMKDIDGNLVQGWCLVKLYGKNEIGLMGRPRGQDQERIFPRTDTTYASRTRTNFCCFWRSPDGGRSWQPPVLVTPPDEPASCMCDSLVRLSSGRIIQPVYMVLGQDKVPGNGLVPRSGRLVANQWVSVGGHHFDPRVTCAFVVYSDDDGRTWHRNEDGELFVLMEWNNNFYYCNEGTIAEVAPGRLLMFLRTGLGRLFQAWSDDNGQTWTRPQPSPLASPTGTPALRSLPNGHLLAVWNQSSEQEIKAGLTLCRLSSAISRNGGSVWEFFQNIESSSEITRVEPGPVRPTRPDYIVFPPGQPAVEHDPQYVIEAASRLGVKSPSILVMKDRVLIAYPYSKYVEHPTKAQLVPSEDMLTDLASGKPICQKLKILPLKWFYGGKEPADNPFLKTAYEPAKP